MLLLIVELSKKQLISWNCLDILYQNTNLFKTIITLHENENLENLGAFFEEVIANLEYIKDIINLFPYSLFENSNFSLINEILYIIVKNTSEKKVNFQIKIKDEEYNFNYTQNKSENTFFMLDLNSSNENKLIITDKTIVRLPISNKGLSIYLSNIANKFNIQELSKRNRFFLLLIEKILNNPIIDKSIFGNIIIKSSKESDNKININMFFDLGKLFKSENNIIVNIWSILYLNENMEKYLSKKLKTIEKDMFDMLTYIKNDILDDSEKNQKTFKEKLFIIISMSKDLYSILDKNSFIINISKDENYIENMKINSIE